MDVPPERLAIAAVVQSLASLGSGIPFGAAEWPQPFDPADHLPFGFSFEQLLDEGETIVDVERIALSSAGAALGLIVDKSSDFAPIIDAAAGRAVQLWFSVDPDMQNGAPFDAAGARVPVTFRVLTSKAHRFERSAVLTVRQL